MTTNLIELGMAAPGHEEIDARFERLLERYASLLRSLIAQHCPRDLGIQIADIEQEARVRLWRALQREKNFDDPASYIYRIAVTTTIDAVRRVMARREEQLESGSDDDSPHESIPADAAEQPDIVATRRELLASITAAVAALPDNRRRAVELHLQGLTLAEIAELLGWSEAKVRNLVYRGLDDLREILRGQGIESK